LLDVLHTVALPGKNLNNFCLDCIAIQEEQIHCSMVMHLDVQSAHIPYTNKIVCNLVGGNEIYYINKNMKFHGCGI